MEKLWNITLEDPDERFYLLYSFYQMKYAQKNKENV